MGIRIHKVLGYGLDNVKTKKGNIIDTRFKPVDDLYEWMEYKEHSFRKWMLKNVDKIPGIIKTLVPSKALDNYKKLTFLYIVKQKEKKNQNLFVYDFDSGRPNVIMFVPYNYTDWYRYDNIIDYTEQCVAPKTKVTNLFKKYNIGIDPFNYMELAPNKKSLINRPYQHPPTLMTKMSMTERRRFIDDYESQGNSIVAQHLKNDWIPEIPLEIVLFCIYSEIFRDPNTIYDLRPMHYIYWA